MKNHRTETIWRNQIHYLNMGSGEPLLFLHGFGVPSSFYTELIDELAQTNEVIAPDMYGMNVFRAQPVTPREYTDLTLAFAQRLGHASAHYAGHSYGGAVALQAASLNDEISDVVAMSPLLPVDYGVVGFTMRAGYKTAREIKGVEGELSSRRFARSVMLPFAINFVRDIRSSLKSVKSMCDFDYDFTVDQPTRVLIAGEDEYFDLDADNEDRLRQKIINVEIKRLPGMNHDWPIFSPVRAAQEVQSFYAREQ